MWVKDLFHFEKNERCAGYPVFGDAFKSGNQKSHCAEFSSSEVCWILNPETLR